MPREIRAVNAYFWAGSVTRLAAVSASTRHIIATLAMEQARIIMMEHPSIMSRTNLGFKNSLRLSAIALTVSLASCSLNPWADDDEAPAPVAQTSTAPSGSSSLDASKSMAPASSQPVLQRISDPVPLADGHPNEYTVKDGDTLWDIASVFLRDPWYWPEVWYVNPQVENPHLIYPGDILSLVSIDGRERVINLPVSAYRLSPQARVTPLDEAIASIPYEKISAFLATGVVLEKSEAEALPYILSVRGDHLVGAAGNDLYIRGGEPAVSGTRYSVVHIGDQLVDPDDGNIVGYHGIYIGEGSLSRGGDPSTVALSETTREALAGDRLVPESVDIPLNFFPRAPEITVDGRIISVAGGVTQIGQYQVIVMNRGARNGLAPGDVLTVFQAGGEVRDRYAGGSLLGANSWSGGEKVTLPDEKAGTVMVFKTYERISYGLIMEATTNIHLYDKFKTPDQY
jgi:hypothetical protein